jgi:hypothetical protein
VCHTLARAGARIALREGTTHFVCKACAVSLLGENANSSDDRVSSQTLSTSSDSNATEAAAIADIPARMLAAVGTPYCEALLALVRARCGTDVFTSYTRLIPLLGAFRFSAAPFVLTSVVLLCSPLPDHAVNDVRELDTLARRTSVPPVDEPDDDAVFGSAAASIASPAVPVSSTSGSAQFARELLDAFVCVDVDLLYAGCLPSAGRSLPGGSVARSGPSNAKNFLKNE